MDGFSIKASIQSVVFSHLGAQFQVGNWTNIFKKDNKHVSGGISHKWVKVWLVIILQQLTGIEIQAVWLNRCWRTRGDGRIHRGWQRTTPR